MMSKPTVIRLVSLEIAEVSSESSCFSVSSTIEFAGLDWAIARPVRERRSWVSRAERKCAHFLVEPCPLGAQRREGPELRAPGHGAMSLDLGPS